MNWFSIIEHILGMGVGIGAILGPIFVAFYRKDRDALQRLLAAIPDIWNLVQKEREKGSPATAKVNAQSNPLGRAIEVAGDIHGRALNATEKARVEAALKSVTEAVKAATGRQAASGGSVQLTGAGMLGIAGLAPPTMTRGVAMPSTAVPLVVTHPAVAPTK